MFGPVWVERVDGTVEPAAWHNMSEEARHGVARAFHAGCFVPDRVPEWMRPSGDCVELPRTTVAAHRSFRLSGTRWSTPTRVAAATLSLACAAVAALDAATVVLHGAPR